LDLSQERFERTLNLIYDTLDKGVPWRDVLECLHEAVGGRAIHLLAFDARNGALSYSDGADMAPQIDLEYIQKYQFIDPRVGLMRTRWDGDWLHCHEHFDEAFVADHPFYQEFLIPHGARYLTACKLVEDSKATVILACLRRAAEGAMPREVLAFLERLHPHLQRAVRMGLDRFVYSVESLVGHALVNRLRQPVMLLTTGGEIVLANEAARRLLGTTSLVQVADNRLVLPQAYRRSFFEQCARLEHQLRAGGTPDEAAGKAFRTLHMRSGTDEAPDVLYGFYSMLVPERTLGSFGLRPLVMLFFYHPDSAQPIDSALLTAAFGLSHAECRIASLLADGMPLKDIAATLGVRYDTVRKQLMSIYQKTSTNRQPELVRLLMNLPASAVRSALEADGARFSGITA